MVELSATGFVRLIWTKKEMKRKQGKNLVLNSSSSRVMLYPSLHYLTHVRSLDMAVICTISYHPMPVVQSDCFFFAGSIFAATGLQTMVLASIYLYIYTCVYTYSYLCSSLACTMPHVHLYIIVASTSLY